MANSEALLARVADHSGRELVVAGDLEASARGAAMLAAIAPGVDAEPLEVPASERSIQPSADDDTRTAARARHHAAIDAARQVAGA